MYRECKIYVTEELKRTLAAGHCREAYLAAKRFCTALDRVDFDDLMVTGEYLEDKLLCNFFTNYFKHLQELLRRVLLMTVHAQADFHTRVRLTVSFYTTPAERGMIERPEADMAVEFDSDGKGYAVEVSFGAEEGRLQLHPKTGQVTA